MTIWLMLAAMAAVSLAIATLFFRKQPTDDPAALDGAAAAVRSGGNEAAAAVAADLPERDASPGLRWPAGPRGHALAAVAGGLVVLFALGGLGLVTDQQQSALPAGPQVGQAPVGTSDLGALERYLKSRSVPREQSVPGALAGPGSVDEVTERLAARLAREPNNPEGWRMLGWTYFSTERYGDAAAAYAKAVEFNPANAALMSIYGEAVVRAAGGQVTGTADGIFAAALKLDAKDPRARFFKGLEREQAGDKRAALEDWLGLLADASATDDWAAELRQRVGELAAAIGVDISARLASVPQVSVPQVSEPQVSVPRATGGLLKQIETAGAAQAATARERGPTAADVKAADAMSEADRSAMIRGMVEGLQQRLEAAPRDADGWIKLIRSRVVLGEAGKAAAALQRARQVFEDAPDERRRIEAAAQQLGVVR